MNEQQMREKYAKIIQFQFTYEYQETEELLKVVIPLLDIPFDWSRYEEARQFVKEDVYNQILPKSVYYAKSRRDPRCLILLSFRQSYLQCIIRFRQQDEQEIRSKIAEVRKKKLENTLIQQSKMNSIVDLYHLDDIDIVDENDVWRTVFQQKNFWSEYGNIDHWEENIYPMLVTPICFAFGSEIELQLNIGDEIGHTYLDLKHPERAAPYSLAWDDGAHPHSDLMRWEEFEQLILYLTIRYPNDFVIPFLLLLRFVPVTAEDDERWISRKIVAALRSLALFHEDEIGKLYDLINYRPNFTWTYDQEEDRYYIGKDAPLGVRSTREIKGVYGEFPFQQFADLIHSTDSYRNTADWQKAKKKWTDLIEQYSTSEDETWLARLWDRD
jgi:hypothetical protein